MKIRLFGVLWRLDEEQDTAQPDLDLDKLLKEQIRYRGNQEQRQAKKDAAQSEEGAEINPAKVDTMLT